MPQRHGYYNEPFAVAVGHAIRTLRIDRGLSQAALAEHVGINRQHINSIENGRVKVSLEVFMVIAAELGVFPSDILALTPYDPHKKNGKRAYVVGRSNG